MILKSAFLWVFLLASPTVWASPAVVSLGVHATLSFCSTDVREASCVPAGVDGRGEITVELKGGPDFAVGTSSLPLKFRDPSTGAELTLTARVVVERSKADGEILTRLKFEPQLSRAGGPYTPLTKVELELLQWPGVRTFSSAGAVNLGAQDLRWEFLFFPRKDS